MTDSTCFIYIVLIASVVSQLEASSSTSSESSATPSMREPARWWEFIVYPANSFQTVVNNQLVPAFEAKNANDVDKMTEIEKIFDKFSSLAQGFRNEMADMDIQLEATFGRDLEKEEFAMCRMYYQLWRNKGDHLAVSYRRCRENNEPVAKQYLENMLEVEEHLFSVLGEYYNSIETYRNMDGFLSGLRSLVLSIWTYIKWTFFESTVDSEMSTYIQNSRSLREIKEHIGGDDACVPRHKVDDFHSLAETMIQNLKICVDAILSKNTPEPSKGKRDRTKLN